MGFGLGFNFGFGAQAQAVVVAAPTISAHPSGGAYNGETAVTLSVTATGTPTYQWYAGSSGDTSSPIGGATNSTYAASPAATTSYWVRCTNAGGTADSNAASVTLTYMTTNLKGEWLGQSDADFTFSSGDNVATWKEHANRGAGDLDFAFVSGTRAVKTATHPVNTTGETVDTANAGGDYITPAGGTLADLFPAGTGTCYIKFYYDRHVDAFTAPDHILFAGSNFKINVVDGTTGKLRVQLTGGNEASSLDITDDIWVKACIRVGNGAGLLKIKVNAQAEQTGTGATIATLTDRISLFYDTGDAGRLDGAVAVLLFYSDIHSDAQRDHNLAAIDELFAT